MTFFTKTGRDRRGHLRKHRTSSACPTPFLKTRCHIRYSAASPRLRNAVVVDTSILRKWTAGSFQTATEL